MKHIAIPARLQKENLTVEEQAELATLGNQEMTAEEITARLAEEAANIIKAAEDKLLADRQKTLAAKWPDAFDLLDDILERGVEAVKIDRDVIKQANPKGELT